jgi:hypothetical protein
MIGSVSETDELEIGSTVMNMIVSMMRLLNHSLNNILNTRIRKMK